MLETELVDHASCIIGEPRDVERFPIVSRATDPAVVDEDQLVRRRETIDERRIPIGVRRGKSVQNKQPQAIPNATIVRCAWSLPTAKTRETSSSARFRVSVVAGIDDPALLC